MYGKKALIITTSLILLAFLLYLFLPDFNQTEQVSISMETTTASVMKKEVEEHISEDPVVEEEPLEDEGETDKPVTEEIKEKVREVLEGAIEFFKKDEKIVAIGD
ncbi:MAG TPA: hypothetical protein VEV44_01975, partial [Pseudoneobacillus sp.]|nr:hypothetical protein [Pseudoneobacillus sp.]